MPNLFPSWNTVLVMAIKRTAPKVFEYATGFYDALVRNAENREVDGATIRVYEGKVTSLFQTLGISQGYYTPIMSVLRELGSVTQLQRGGKGQPSIVAIHRPPDRTDFEGLPEKPLTPNADVAILQDRLSAVERLIGGMDIVGAFVELERRLKVLEASAAKGGKKNAEK